MIANFISFACARSAPNTFYVSQGGSNSNNGSINSPWKTISYAVSRLIPGDRLCIGSGTWSSDADFIDSRYYTVPSGNDLSSGAITIGGCNGDKPTIKPLNGYSGISLTVGAPSNLIFQDMIFDGSLQEQPNPPDSGAELLYTSSGTHHIRFQRLTIAHTMSHAIQFSMSNSTADFNTAIEFLDSIVYDVGNATGDSGHGGDGVNNGYGLYTFTKGNTIFGSEFYDTRGVALVVYGPDNIVVANRFHDTNTRGNGSGAVNFGSSSHPVPSIDNYFANNYVYNNPGGGIQIYTNSNVYAWNNTFYKNGEEAILAQYCLGGAVQNNIFRLNSIDVMNYTPETCKITESNNLPSAVDPLFTDPDNGNFSISNNSPAFNKGVALDLIKKDFMRTIRPQVNLYDIGAFELVEDEPEPPVENNSKTNYYYVLNGQVTVGSNLLLADLVCSNSTGDREIVTLSNQSALRTDGFNSIYMVPSNQTLPLIGLNLRFTGTLVASGNNLNCNFGVIPMR